MTAFLTTLETRCVLWALEGKKLGPEFQRALERAVNKLNADLPPAYRTVP